MIVYRIIVVSVLLIFLVFPAAWAADQDWLPPRVIYIADPSCKDYLRALQEPGCEKDYFRYWAYGYLSGRNDSLPDGGNVLGSMDASADDFLARVRAYCTRHPDQAFFNANHQNLAHHHPRRRTGKAPEAEMTLNQAIYIPLLILLMPFCLLVIADLISPRLSAWLLYDGENQ